MSYLRVTHPEVFFALPRPGGLANIPPKQGDEKKERKGDKSVGDKSKKSISTLRSTKSLAGVKSSKSAQRKSFFETSFMTQSGGYVSREERIKMAMETVPWAFEKSARAIPQPPNPLQDSIDILAIVISTIMLLAADYKEIPINNLKWTLSYLECVKDEVGNCPPNVVGIINHIRSIDETIESFNEKVMKVIDDEDGEQVSGAKGGEQVPPEASAPSETPVVASETPTSPELDSTEDVQREEEPEEA